MKVTLPKNYKDDYYLPDIEAMKAAIKELKFDETKPADIITAAAKKWANDNGEVGFFGDPISVSVVSVETCKDYKLQYDQICEGSRYTDVMFFGFANYWKGTLRIFVTLTDYWFNDSEAVVAVAKYPEIFG